jgi:tetratricopeptide (TPR) repeat protein
MSKFCNLDVQLLTIGAIAAILLACDGGVGIRSGGVIGGASASSAVLAAETTPDQTASTSSRWTLLWVMLLPLSIAIAMWLILERLEEQAHRHTEEVVSTTSDAIAELSLLVSQTKTALQDVQTYLDRPPLSLETPSDYCQHGNALFQAGHYTQAIAAYDQAIAMNPEFYQAWNNRGSTCFRAKRYDEAIANFDRAIELKPDYAQAWQNRELALLARGSGEKGGDDQQIKN